MVRRCRQLLVLAFLLAPLPVSAEQPDSRWLAHGFGGPFGANRASGGFHVGGGAEGLLGRFSVGADAGLLDQSPFFSLGGGFYAPALGRGKSVVPFFKGGVTALSSDSPTWIHFGGGVDYWPRPRVGLRFELRDHVASGASDAHVLGVRFGIVTRW